MEGFDERLNELERRIARIEARLDQLGEPVSAMSVAGPAPQPPPLPRQSSRPEVVQARDERGALVPREAFEDESPGGEIDRPAHELAGMPAPPEAVDESHPGKAAAFDALRAGSPVDYERSVPPALLPPGNARPVGPAHAGFEQAIGLKLAGWIGAIVVVIGAAMGVKFAYDQGWLGGLPDSVKLGIYYAVGIGLIGAGEYVHRKVNPVAAVGLYAAGIAGLFVVSYAGNAYYQLYEQPVAFALMAGACAIGALIALRGGLVSIAILSLLGANIAPIILRNRAVGQVPLLVYLLALQLLALALAHIGKGARWWILRNFSLATLSLWMAARLLSPASAYSAPTVCFVALYAALFQIENALAARKQGGGTFSHPTFSFAVTAALAIALLRWSMPLSDIQRGAIMVALSFIAFTAGATVFFSKLQPLRMLGQSWLVQGGILLFVAVPVALSGPWIFVAWAIMALGYVILGATVGRLRTAVGGVLVWYAAALLLVARVAGDPAGSSLNQIAFNVAGIAIPTYFLIGLLVSAIGHAIAIVLSRRFIAAVHPSGDQPMRSLASSVAIAATILKTIVCVAALPSLTTTGAGIAIAWLCFCLSFAARPTANVYRALAGAVIALAVARWVGIDVIADRFSDKDLAGHRLLFNASIGTGIVAVGSLWALVKLAGRQASVLVETYSHVLSVSILLGVAAMCIALSVEIERAVHHAVAAGQSFVWPRVQVTNFGWTALWSIAAAALPWIARTMGVREKQLAELKAGSTLLICVIAAKFILFDCFQFVLQNHDAGVRVLLNAQVLLAVILIGLLIFAARTTTHIIARNVARAMIFLLPLVVGSIEISRDVGESKTLVAFSVYWGLYAIASIAVGFAVRSSVLRYAGLGLLGITLMKIVFVDLADAGTGWRILSFLGVGTILLATSVLYGKLSPRLLGRMEPGERA